MFSISQLYSSSNEVVVEIEEFLHLDVSGKTCFLFLRRLPSFFEAVKLCKNSFWWIWYSKHKIVRLFLLTLYGFQCWVIICWFAYAFVSVHHHVNEIVDCFDDPAHIISSGTINPFPLLTQQEKINFGLRLGVKGRVAYANAHVWPERLIHSEKIFDFMQLLSGTRGWPPVYARTFKGVGSD